LKKIQIFQVFPVRLFVPGLKRVTIISSFDTMYKKQLSMAHPVRPVSPHLQIYKPQLTSVLSIFHRMTGVISFAGSIFILIWLVSLAWDAPLYSFLQEVATSIPVQIGLFFWSLALIYHLLNGIRHLGWDAGKGFEIPDIYKSGKLVIGLSIAVTLLIWVTKII